MVQFLIDHLDPLGQGVSKRINAKKQSIVTFIPKTLPGEQGSANIIKSAKGVEFAELSTLDKKSPQRISAECEHYERCSGCDYLHVSYEDELAYKKSALLFLLRFLNLQEADIELIPATERFGYRNRVQLHYRHKYLGLVDANADQILEIPHCRLVSPAIKEAMQQLYGDKSWTTEYSGRGHVELYEKNNTVARAWNEPYAEGGFSQVNESMNQKMRQWLQERLKNENFSTLLDLFSGDGNLSDVLMAGKDIQRVMVDSYGEDAALKQNPQFIQQDLFAEDALNRFMHRSKLKTVDLLLLDPPRKGFPALAEWDKQLKPKNLVYISCNPATLSRDLQLLLKQNQKLKITSIVLLDMFPGTRHFETLVLLTKR